MRPLIVIVADDLTGAADCGVACTAAGLSTVVVLSEPSRTEGLDAEAIAFDADTRRQPPDAAATGLAVHQLCASGSVRVLYKKIDSTLRGNFAVEIAAAGAVGIRLVGEVEPGVLLGTIEGCGTTCQASPRPAPLVLRKRSCAVAQRCVVSQFNKRRRLIYERHFLTNYWHYHGRRRRHRTGDHH
jgi:hypothetical protein